MKQIPQLFSGQTPKYNWLPTIGYFLVFLTGILLIILYKEYYL